MKLSNFIQETIFEIALGIHSAKVRAKDLVAVSPGMMDGKDVIEKSYIDFDVSVVVKEASQSKKGGKGSFSGSIKVAEFASVGVSAGGEAEKGASSESEQVHRITFKVPVYFNAHHRADGTMAGEADLIGRIVREHEERQD
jgi:hypothetical protein